MKISKKVSEKYGISVRSAKDYIHEGLVCHDGIVVRKDIDSVDDDFLLKLPEKMNIDPKPYLLADFGDVVFFDKPSFMHSERHRIGDEITMEDIAKNFDPTLRLISRLDHMTDGVIASVRGDVEIISQKKTYLAYVCGEMKETVTLDNIIDADKRKKVKVTEIHGGNSTVFTPLKYENGFTLVQAEIEKATRHQLRAYLSYLNHPILGDISYGGKEHLRIMLHCKSSIINGFYSESRLTENFIF
jgi:23S rRNA-/tRNA-specific pseudouridylate synthase